MRAVLALLLATPWAAAAPSDSLPAAFLEAQEGLVSPGNEDGEFSGSPFFVSGCRRADRAQTALVDRGNAQKQRYLAACARSGASALRCEQSLRPNPDSRSVFACTYGEDQPHQLIHPHPATWPHVFKALALAAELSRQGIAVCLINNWWRPEPYNANVGGAAGRHPAGTSVDVEFCTSDDRDKAFVALCRLRRQGRLRALGYYPGSPVLHLGIADRVGNTWGKACP